LGERRTIEKVNGGDNSTNLKTTNLDQRAIHIHRKMEHNLVEKLNTKSWKHKKSQEGVNSQEK
jgi:hypothetical protein